MAGKRTNRAGKVQATARPTIRPTIGVLIGWHLYWTPNPYGYLMPIFRGISAAATDRQCNLLLACGMGPQTYLPDPNRPAWPTLANDVDFVPIGPWNTDGLIVINPLISESRSRNVHEWRQAGHPVIYIGNGEGDPTIASDNEGGILQALTHLIEQHGHQRIAYIAGNPGDVGGDSSARLQAYQVGLERYGLPLDSNLMSYGYHTFEGGYEAMHRILATGASFTAVVASNDESAMGAMQVLKEAGLNIPKDVAIIGYDDRQESASQIPPLTSIHVPLYQSGYTAITTLLEYIGGQQDALRSRRMPTNLAIRQSCGCRQDTGISHTRSAPSVQIADVDTQQAAIIDSMTESALTETQRFNAEVMRDYCSRLFNSFIRSIEQRDSAEFQQVMQHLMEQTEQTAEDAHLWQTVITSLRAGVPVLIQAADHADDYQFALDILDQARSVISEQMRRQHGRYIIDQKWMINRIGHLTTRLLMTSNEAQIFEALSIDLKAMDINYTSLSFFEAEGDDPVAWSILHSIPGDADSVIRYPTREFPPEGAYPTERAISLVLVPLVLPKGQIGFIAYDSANLELAGPITQQVAAALNNARLYAEAHEGRKLAEEANNLKSRFLSMVSHELRTPLGLISGLSEMLLQKGSDQGVEDHLQEQLLPLLPDQYRKDIQQIYSNAQHLGRLIRDVLDLASSEIGQLRLENEPLDLSETLEMVAATGRQMAKDKGLDWHESLFLVPMWVWGDRTRLRQVALNLVSNAIKFTSNGEVRLRVEVEADNAVITVSDTGSGIPPKDQAFIFDEFRRSEKTVARGIGGLGLGLAISKRLVEMHGGEISVSSSGEEGAGATFTVRLPLIEPDAIHSEDQLDQLGLLESDQAILVLTNQSGTGARLRDHLIQQGNKATLVQIEQSESDNDLLSPILNAVKTSPGAIVLDISVAPTQGWKILRALKDHPTTRDVPMLFYSLNAEQGAMLELDYLTKPVGMAELGRVLEYQKLTWDERRTQKVFLVVDDDPATLEMHVRIVQSRLGEQHQVLKARTGREALDLIQDALPDLVLLDLMMPDLDGFEVLEAMREKEATRDIPVIVLTGQMLTEKDMARLNRGVATVLSKGVFSVEETLTHIDAALARKRKLGSEAQRLVRRAMAYIHEHYAEPISREELGRQLGMSGDYLTLCFRREVGLTFVAYLNRYRVNQAKAMLAENSKTISEIAMAVGFSDNAYFSRVFRQHTGVSPDVYRRTAGG